MAWREDSDLHFKLILNNIPVIMLKDAVVVPPIRKAKWGISTKEEKKRCSMPCFTRNILNYSGREYRYNLHGIIM
jgi:hypothetical protein